MFLIWTVSSCYQLGKLGAVRNHMIPYLGIPMYNNADQHVSKCKQFANASQQNQFHNNRNNFVSSWNAPPWLDSWRILKPEENPVSFLQHWKRYKLYKRINKVNQKHEKHTHYLSFILHTDTFSVFCGVHVLCSRIMQ